MQPAFDNNARLGRILLLGGAYSPALVVLGLRIGFDDLGFVLISVGLAGVIVWLLFLLQVVPHRQRWEIEVIAAEPVDRDVTAYIATYLLPVLAAKPEHGAAIAAYVLAAVLVLVVAFRADLGAVNPLAYVFGFRAFRVSAADGVRIVLSRSSIVKDSAWEVQEAAGVMVATRPST
ncbi:MAG: hypothetical protein WKF96_12860 [Solirubrobacteraceae bacterium]